MMEVERWRPGDVLADDLDAVRDVQERAYAPTSRPIDLPTAIRRRREAHQRWVVGSGAPPAALMHVVRVGDRCAAVAVTFVRTVGCAGGSLPVLALAGVASDPDDRGRGFGRAVVLDALLRVPEGVAGVCLFQTGQARGFYEKLGCVGVDNAFIDSKAGCDDRPWWDPHIMRYPADAPWPTGRIDLCGPAY